MYTITATRYQNRTVTHIIRHHADDSWWIVTPDDLHAIDNGEIPTDDWLTEYTGE